MRILVTGGAGFIGSHLCDALLAAGYEVSVLDDLSAGSQENLAEAGRYSGFTFVQGDIRDRSLVDATMANCDGVVHLAARIGLRAVVSSPLQTMEVNARGTECILESAVTRRLPTIIASTSEVYGHSVKIPSAESDPICFGSPTVGRWSYACTKAYDEFFAMALHNERGLPAVAVRLFNTIGSRQTGRYGMVIPRFVNQALSGEALTVYGDGSQTRCFCSVTDVVGGLMTMLERIDSLAGEVFNLGNPQELSILELAQTVIEVTQSSSRIELVPFSEVYPAGFEEIMRRVPDISKAAGRLQFAPKENLDSILRSVVASVREKEALV
ncbi:MAG: GDP-mannose 4,6-dehydratase [Vulcanimicrobiaceae bacterium]